MTIFALARPSPTSEQLDAAVFGEPVVFEEVPDSLHAEPVPIYDLRFMIYDLAFIVANTKA